VPRRFTGRVLDGDGGGGGGIYPQNFPALPTLPRPGLGPRPETPRPRPPRPTPAVDPDANPVEPAPLEPPPSPAQPSIPSEPRAESEPPLQALPGWPGAVHPVFPRDDGPRRPRARAARSDAFPVFPSHILGARRPVDFPRPRSVTIPRGTPRHPSGLEEISQKANRAIERVLERLKKKRERFRPRGGPASGGWSWDVYEARARRAMEDTVRRRQQMRRRTGMPPAPRPMTTEREDIEQAAEAAIEQLEREPVMPPLPRAPGDITHSMPRPAPEALPPMDPSIHIPPVQIPRPQPVSSGAPSTSSSTPSAIPSPLGIVIPGLLAAAGVFVSRQTNTRSRSIATPQAAVPSTRQIDGSTPNIPSPGSLSSAPPSPPSTPLTATNAPGADSCPTPRQQRKEEKRKRDEKRKECRQFLSVRVPAHKRKMCIADLAKYLFRKAQRTARAALRKKIIEELERRGVPASDLIKLTKRPRRRKAEVEIGGVEIDLEDLLGK
jgi:hypothetical protein